MENNSDPSFRGYKKPRGLRGKLLLAIQSGGEKTSEGWADHFHTSEINIRRACGNLRKKGYLIYPIGGKAGFNSNQGILKLLKEKMAFYSETMDRQYKNYLNPQLVSAARQIEEGLANYPKLAPMYKDFARELLVRATLIENEFKSRN